MSPEVPGLLELVVPLLYGEVALVATSPPFRPGSGVERDSRLLSPIAALDEMPSSSTKASPGAVEGGAPVPLLPRLLL